VAGVGVGSGGSTSATLPVNGGNGYIIIAINSCGFPYYLSGGVCVCTAGYYISGGVCTICPVGSCCLGNLTAATACLGSTAQGAAALAGEL